MNLLDHGSIDLIETWGSDERIIEEARQSTQKGFLGWGPLRCKTCNGVGGAEIQDDTVIDWVQCEPCKGTGLVKGDEKLLRYLWEHGHTTPFEFAGATIHVTAPIFVLREWHRHRTQSFAEASARYAPLPDVNYLPTLSRIRGYDVFDTNAQAAPGSPGLMITNLGAQAWLDKVEDLYKRIQMVYEHGLIEGVPKELARIVLPVGRYTRMGASANLHNWLRFIALRSAPNAQEEIRVYSDALLSLLEPVFPRTVALFKETR